MDVRFEETTGSIAALRTETGSGVTKLIKNLKTRHWDASERQSPQAKAVPVQAAMDRAHSP